MGIPESLLRPPIESDAATLESKESSARYRGLLEAAPDAMVVVDQDGEIVLLNIQAEKQFGYSRYELVGQKVKRIIPEGFAERLVADGLRSAAEALAQQMGMGIELTGRRKNGSEFPIEIMLSPLENAAGILVTAAIRDISVRKASEKRLAGMDAKRGLVEEELRQSEEQYRMLLDGIQDHAIFMINPRGQVVSWNAGAQRLKGYTADEIIGQNFSCFFPPEDIARGRPAEVLRLTVANGSHEEHGMRVRKDGSRFLASVTFAALRDRAGELRGFSEFSRDLSESKESGAKYRGLLEAAPDAMVVVNQRGEIVLLNVQAENSFGYSRDELIGQPVKNIIPEGFAERLIADDLRSAAEALAQQIGTGLELSGRRKDGSEFPIELMLSPLESPEGILVTAAIRDISVRKAAEKHLVQMEGRYRGLLEAAPDAMVVVNQRGEIVLLNVQAEKCFGYSRDELIGQPVKNIIPEGFAERLIADDLRSAAEALAQQIGTGLELSGRRKDGSEFPIELMLSPLESPEGILVTAAIRDIAARKQSEAHLLEKVFELNHSNVELMDANKELEAFTYSVSHDLRAPLRHMDGFSKLLLEQEASGLSENGRGYLQDIRDSTLHMGQLVDDLLGLARLGRKELARRVTELGPLVDEVITDLQRANADRLIEWKVGQLPVVECDPGLVRQVFVNLLSNSVKFTRPRETAVIEVGTTFESGHPTFFVRDNGVGFNMKTSSKLFGVFQRLHRQEDFEGTGVGLATVQRIVHKHGGRIWPQAERNVGATFFFTLPQRSTGQGGRQ